MTRVAIMQPTYMPWIGYMAMMDAVDVFVFLDSVQFDRRSWQQRNRIKTPSGELMLTVPVRKKGLRDQTIAETLIDHSDDPLDRHARSLAQFYAKAPFFAAHGPGLAAVLAAKPEKLVDLNLGIVAWARAALGVSSHLQRSSAMVATGRKADLLAAICAELGASSYLAPPGSRAYLAESDAMARHGIAVEFFEYACVPYAQLHGAFVPYMGIVDLVLNMGALGAEAMRAGILDSHLDGGVR